MKELKSNDPMFNTGDFVPVIMYPILLNPKQQALIAQYFNDHPGTHTLNQLEASLIEYFNWFLNETEEPSTVQKFNPALWIHDPREVPHTSKHPSLVQNDDPTVIDHDVPSQVQKRAVLSFSFVNNVTKKIRENLQSQRMQEILDRLTHCLQQDELQIEFKHVTINNQLCVESVAITSPHMSELSRLYGHSCALNSVVGVSEPNMFVGSIVVKDNHGHIRTVFVCLLTNETTEQWEWALSHFRNTTKLQFRTIATDEGPAILEAVRRVFPNSQMRRCLFHIESNFRKRRNILQRDGSVNTCHDDSSTWKEFKALWHRVIFSNSNGAMMARWNALITYVRSKNLLDLENHLNNNVFQKLVHVANIYFKGQVCPLATSIAESNHNMLKSLLKKETAQAKLQQRSVDIVRLIFVACEVQPVHQERLTLLSSHRRERRIAKPSNNFERTVLANLKETCNTLFGETVLQQLNHVLFLTKWLRSASNV